MIVVMRFRVPEDEQSAFRTDLGAAADLLAAKPGHEHGWVGRNVDDPELWTLVTVWASVGAYRRALSAHDTKMHAVPLLSRALDEPSAYEPAESDEVLNHEVARGSRSAPR